MEICLLYNAITWATVESVFANAVFLLGQLALCLIGLYFIYDNRCRSLQFNHTNPKNRPKIYLHSYAA